MPTTTKPAIDSKVIIKPEIDADCRFTGLVFKVVSHARVNILVESINHKPGTRPQRVRINPEHTQPAPEGAENTTVDPNSMLIPAMDHLPLGTVFTVVAGALRNVDEGTLLVVIGGGGTAYKATRLGGDGDRYWPKVARAAMRPIPAEQVVAAMKSGME